jgi:hypothetical protein
VATLADPKTATFSPTPLFGSLGKEKPLKASSSKASAQGCHDFEYLAALASEHPTSGPKAANCEGIGEPWHSWFISDLLNEHPKLGGDGPSEPCRLLH